MIRTLATLPPSAGSCFLLACGCLGSCICVSVAANRSLVKFHVHTSHTTSCLFLLLPVDTFPTCFLSLLFLSLVFVFKSSSPFPPLFSCFFHRLLSISFFNLFTSLNGCLSFFLFPPHSASLTQKSSTQPQKHTLCDSEGKHTPLFLSRSLLAQKSLDSAYN